MSTPGNEPILRSRLLPQFSFRSLLALTAVAALLATTVRMAGDGGALARAILFAVAIPVTMALLGCILFLASWVVATVSHQQAPMPKRNSPFAEDELPTQILPPRDAVT